MSNPALDRAAQLVAQRRATGELAMLDGPEHHLVDEALKLAPELDPATIGAAWMMLGDILGRFATELPDAFPGSTLAILAQLAGQRLYTGTDVPREAPCPVVRSNGSPCPFSAKAVTADLIDAQMRGHYATYHETLTWAPERRVTCGFCGQPVATAEDGTLHAHQLPPVADSAPQFADLLPPQAIGHECPGSGRLRDLRHLEEPATLLGAHGLMSAQEMRDELAGDGGAIVKCERCTDPVVVREGGATDGVLCQRCVAADGA